MSSNRRNRSDQRRLSAFRLYSRSPRRIRYLPALESLEDITLLSTVNWTNPAGGDWDTVTNWSTGALPKAGDDVVINEPGSVTITHSANTTDSVKSISASDPISLSGGTLSVAGSFSDTGAVTLLGGTLSNATIAAGTTLQTSQPGNGSLETDTLQNVSIAGSLVYVRNDTVNITGSGLTLSGATINIGNGGSLNFSGTETLGGTGNVTFTEGSVNVTNSGKLTIAAGITLQGSENDAYNTNLNASSGSIDNLGTIDANSSAGQGFTITSGSGGSWTNDGTLEATSGGNLKLNGSWTNDAGHSIIVNASTINFNGSWTNQGALTSQGASTVNLAGNFTLATIGSYTRDAAGNDKFVIGGTLTLTGHTLDSSRRPG